MKTSSPSLLFAIVGYDPWLPVLVLVNLITLYRSHSDEFWKIPKSDKRVGG